MLKLQEKKRCMVQVCFHSSEEANHAFANQHTPTNTRARTQQGAFGKRSIEELQAMRISDLKLLFDDGPL
jgi:hypothetical protein